MSQEYDMMLIWLNYVFETHFAYFLVAGATLCKYYQNVIEILHVKCTLTANSRPKSFYDTTKNKLCVIQW